MYLRDTSYKSLDLAPKVERSAVLEDKLNSFCVTNQHLVEHVFTPSPVFGLHVDRCIALLHGILHLNQLAASDG